MSTTPIAQHNGSHFNEQSTNNNEIVMEHAKNGADDVEEVFVKKPQIEQNTNCPSRTEIKVTTLIHRNFDRILTNSPPKTPRKSLTNGESSSELSNQLHVSLKITPAHDQCLKTGQDDDDDDFNAQNKSSSVSSTSSSPPPDEFQHREEIMIPDSDKASTQDLVVYRQAQSDADLKQVLSPSTAANVVDESSLCMSTEISKQQEPFSLFNLLKDQNTPFQSSSIVVNRFHSNAFKLLNPKLDDSYYVISTLLRYANSDFIFN